MFHIGIDFDINKSSVVRIIHWVEDVLSKCDEFKLPRKKALLESDNEYEVFLVDATESPIEARSRKMICLHNHFNLLVCKVRAE